MRNGLIRSVHLLLKWKLWIDVFQLKDLHLLWKVKICILNVQVFV